MGKKLVILGADFSANGISVPVELTPTWTNGKAWFASRDGVSPNATSPIGALLNSTQFKASNKIELPAGKKIAIKYTRCIYTTSAGYASGFGLVFWDNNQNPISGQGIPKGERSVFESVVSIPDGAKYVSFTYFMDTDVPFSASCE